MLARDTEDQIGIRSNIFRNKFLLTDASKIKSKI